MKPRPGEPARWRVVLALLVAVLGCRAGSSADSSSQTLRELGELVLDQDVTMDLVAAEPLVFDPVDLEHDEQGRAFVLEMPGYPVVDENERPGRIVELIDLDSDGVFDRRHVFATGFRYADSILPYRGGLLVADPPDLVYVRDTDQDGAADLRQLLLSGFAVGPSESNFNGLRHGLDNWIYGANGSSGGEVFFADRPEEKTSIRGQDFRFRFDLEVAGGSNPSYRLGSGQFETVGRMGGGFGLELDDWGRRFVTHEQRHIQAVVIPERALAAGHRWPPTTVEISDHGQRDQTRIYPIAVPERRVNHPEQSGTFTAGSGLTYYGGDALPQRFRGSFFVAEPVHHLIHRDQVAPHGAGFVARRSEPDHRQGREFLAASDPLFRPVNFTVGPDGALYVLDLQRAVIEHPEWIPDELEATLDVYSGRDRGRIYRLRARDLGRPRRAPATGAPRSGAPRSGAPRSGVPGPGPRSEWPDPRQPSAWIAHLGHANKWWRDTAQRLIVERGSSEVVEPLRETALGGSSLARLHALWTLEGLGQLTAEDVLSALEHPEPGLRENGLVLAAGFLQSSPVLLDRVLELTADPAPRARLQALLTLGTSLTTATSPTPGTEPPLRADQERQLDRAIVTVLLEDADDPWLRIAATSAAATRPLVILERLLESPSIGRPGERDALTGLAQVVGERGLADEVLSLLRLATEALADADGNRSEPLLSGLRAGLDSFDDPPPRLSVDETRQARRALQRLVDYGAPSDLAAFQIGRSLGASTRLPAGRIDRAQRQAADPSVDLEARIRALDLVAASQPDGALELLLKSLSADQPEPLQTAAFDHLRTFSERGSGAGSKGTAELGGQLIAHWASLGAAVRQRVADLLVFRSENQAPLLDALEAGTIPIGELNLHLERRRALLRSRDAEVQQRAGRLFTDLGVTTREAALVALAPALELTGDPARGREVFLELCSRCHAPPSAVPGSTLTQSALPGPDLGDVARRSRSALLHDIVDPNAAVSPQFVAYEVELVSGDTLLGLLIETSAERIVVRHADGQERSLARSDVRRLASSGLSLMPEGLETGMEARSMADLLAFLQRASD